AEAGLQFPWEGSIVLLKKGNYCLETLVAAGAPVYLAAVIEYLAAEVLELAVTPARDNKKSRMHPPSIPSTRYPQMTRN
ncbi:UNVERIFIED_CONTAM: hypothetical protein GTU68_029343, partial [Idotea baltica]|nr:hypothetical protein [Idotea baltica]